MYLASIVLSGAFLVIIAAIVLAQIVGRWFGFLVPSADEFAGFAMAACFFLALPFTLQSGGHIRVSFLLEGVAPRLRHALELFSTVIGTAVVAYAAWYAIDMVWSSWVFGDRAFGMIPIPLWLPQSGLAIGLVGLTVALVDEFFRVCYGRAPRRSEAGAGLPQVREARSEKSDG